MKSALELLLNNGIEQAKDEMLKSYDMYDLKSLVIPMGYKEFWGECAEILSELPVDAISTIAAELTKWFQDLNWPGVDLIEKTLRRLPENRLRCIIQNAHTEAGINEDEEWKFNLCEVFGELDNN